MLSFNKLDHFGQAVEKAHPCCSPVSAGPTCVFAGPCRSAVTVAEVAGGTSSVGDFEGAGLAFLPSAGGSRVLGVRGLLIPSDASVKVTDLFWSCAVGHTCMFQNRDGGASQPAK